MVRYISVTEMIKVSLQIPSPPLDLHVIMRIDAAPAPATLSEQTQLSIRIPTAS